MSEDIEYVELSDEEFGSLPDEVRFQLQAFIKDGERTLEAVMPELNRVRRIYRSLSHVSALRYMQGKLDQYRLSPTLDAIWELESLTSAFVLAYGRVQQGGGGIGFNPNKLPGHLRSHHDRIIELRNKRFAHDDVDTDFIKIDLEVRMIDDMFQINSSIKVQMQIGGDPEWSALVNEVENLLMDALDRALAHLQQKTGREWKFAPHPSA